MLTEDLLDCSDWNWGTVPAWVGAIGSALAFGLAVRIYWVNSRESRKEQARLVSLLATAEPRRLTSTGTRIKSLRSESATSELQPLGGDHYDVVGDVLIWTLRILNLSKESIGHVEGEIVDAKNTEIARFQSFGSMPPEFDTSFVVVSPFDETHLAGSGLHLRFSDASGRRWARYRYEPVRELHRWNRGYRARAL